MYHVPPRAAPLGCRRFSALPSSTWRPIVVAPRSSYSITAVRAPVARHARGSPSVARGTSGGPSVARGTSGGASGTPGTSGGPSVAPGTRGGPSVAPGTSGGASCTPGTSGGASCTPGTSGGPSVAPGTRGGPSVAIVVLALVALLVSGTSAQEVQRLLPGVQLNAADTSGYAPIWHRMFYVVVRADATSADAEYLSNYWPGPRAGLVAALDSGSLASSLTSAFMDVSGATSPRGLRWVVTNQIWLPGAGSALALLLFAEVFAGDRVVTTSNAGAPPPSPTLYTLPDGLAKTGLILWLYPGGLAFGSGSGPDYPAFVDTPHPHLEAVFAVGLPTLPAAAATWPTISWTGDCSGAACRTAVLAAVVSAVAAPALVLWRSASEPAYAPRWADLAAAGWTPLLPPLHGPPLGPTASPNWEALVLCTGGSRCATLTLTPTAAAPRCVCGSYRQDGAVVAAAPPAYCGPGVPNATGVVSTGGPQILTEPYHVVLSPNVTGLGGLAAAAGVRAGPLSWHVQLPKRIGAGGLSVRIEVGRGTGVPLPSTSGTPTAGFVLLDDSAPIPPGLGRDDGAFLWHLASGSANFCDATLAMPYLHGTGVTVDGVDHCACIGGALYVPPGLCAPGYVGPGPTTGACVWAPLTRALPPALLLAATLTSAGCDLDHTQGLNEFGECECVRGAAGRTCELCADGFVRVAVSTGDGSVGPCALTAAVCGPFGARGLDGEECLCATGRLPPDCTVCDVAACGPAGIACGVAGEDSCVCGSGWSPVWVSGPAPPRPGPCSVCAPGFMPGPGPSCVLAACPPGFDLAAASEYGVCVSRPGRGPDGIACAPGYLPDGTGECGTPGANTVCTGTLFDCVCARGWAPGSPASRDCDVCAPGFVGRECTPCPVCGVGACALRGGAPVCVCPGGEPDCGRCLPGHLDLGDGRCGLCPACGEGEECVLGGRGGGTPVCACAPGWDPASACTTCLPDWYYDHVGVTCSPTNVTCGPHGHPDSPSTCACEAPGAGTALAWPQTSCVPCELCPNNTRCLLRGNRAHCECLPGYSRPLPTTPDVVGCALLLVYEAPGVAAGGGPSPPRPDAAAMLKYGTAGGALATLCLLGPACCIAMRRRCPNCCCACGAPRSPKRRRV